MNTETNTNATAEAEKSRQDWIRDQAEFHVTIRLRDAVGNYGGGSSRKESSLEIARLLCWTDVLHNQLHGNKEGEEISREAHKILCKYINNPRWYKWDWIKQNHGCC